jgi:hypothetical protein
MGRGNSPILWATRLVAQSLYMGRLVAPALTGKVTLQRNALRGAVVRLLSAMLTLVLLSGCASQLSKYVRTDGAPVNPAQEQATMAQCKGEAATVPPWRFLEEDNLITACMARNGYIQSR